MGCIHIFVVGNFVFALGNHYKYMGIFLAFCILRSKYDIKGDFNQIVIFKSSINIYNPGSIYKNLNPMKFASSEIGSKIRNILIASVLYKCGYIDAFGTGFDRTFTLCIKNNVDYEYKNDEFGFTFTFLRNPR